LRRFPDRNPPGPRAGSLRTRRASGRLLQGQGAGCPLV